MDVVVNKKCMQIFKWKMLSSALFECVLLEDYKISNNYTCLKLLQINNFIYTLDAVQFLSSSMNYILIKFNQSIGTS